MADRRTDDEPLAPRRPLTGPVTSQPASATTPPGKNSTQTQNPSNPAAKNDSAARNSTGTPNGPGAGGTKPADTGTKQGNSANKPVEAPNKPIPAPSQSQAGKSDVRPSTPGQAGNKPDVTRSSPSQAGNSQGTKPPVTERVSQRVSQAVSAATESVRSAAETRRTEERRPARPPGNRPGSGSSRPRTRKARLRMTHVDPWSVMKTAFLLSIAIGVVTVIAVAMVWSVLGAAGVWDSINKTVQEVIGGGSGSAFNIEDYIGTSRVLGFTMIVAVVDVVLMTAIATLGAFLYNLAATLLGGIEVTLAEEDR